MVKKSAAAASNAKSDVRAADAGVEVLVERDVDVAMRDGARLKADVFCPSGAEKVPAILNLGPYQKDKLWVVPPAPPRLSTITRRVQGLHH